MPKQQTSPHVGTIGSEPESENPSYVGSRFAAIVSQSGDVQRRLLVRDYAIVALCLGIVVFLSAKNHFIQDDGFITLRYVDHFLRGHGPVWYPGSDEFGYTNFLFMLLVTAVSFIGPDPVISANIVSYTAFFAAVIASYLIALRLTSGNRIVAAVTAMVIFTNFTVSSYASGLLETSLQLALVVSVYYATLRYLHAPESAQPLYWATAAGTLGLLTRLDTVLLIAPAFLFLFHGLWTATGRERRRMVAHMVVALACAAAILSAFLWFCFALYGQVLPNTFYVKAGENLRFGWLYLRAFMLEEFLVYPYLVVVLIFHWHRTKSPLPQRTRVNAFKLTLAATALLWMTYATYVGGFMGYRLMIPFIAIFFLLAFTGMGRKFGTAFAVQLAVIAMLTQGGQYFWYSRLEHSSGNQIMNPAGLDWHLTSPRTNYQIIGRRLNDLFYTGQESDVTIAVRAAGAMPYHSRLPTYDIHGLNTREVATGGQVWGNRPGHRKWATVDQLRTAGVNLIVSEGRCIAGLNTVPPANRFAEYARGRSTILIPLESQGCWIVTHYLQPHPDIEDRIASGEFVVLEAS